MNDYYVYGYSDPNSCDPYFYIGKGKDDRCREHLSACFCRKGIGYNLPFYRKLREMSELHIKPEIDIIDKDMSNKEAIALERELIKFYGRIDLKTGYLLNLTDGGEGCPNVLRSDLFKLNASVRLSELRRLYPEKYPGNRLGHDQTLETRSKISKTMLNWSPEVRKARIDAQVKRTGHPICKYDLKTGEIIKMYRSTKAPEKDGYPSVQVHRVLKGQYSSYKGYGFRYLTSEETVTLFDQKDY